MRIFQPAKQHSLQFGAGMAAFTELATLAERVDGKWMASKHRTQRREPRPLAPNTNLQ
jgi:hypothetical protein